MKHFVTVFPPAENVHLLKGVGQIPYQLQRHFGYKSSLICYENSTSYFYHNSQVSGWDIKFIKDQGRIFFLEKGVIKYLYNNALSIDILNLTHLTQENMIYGLLYKYYNPDGILYLRMDMDVNRYKKYGIKFSDNRIKDFIHQRIHKKFLKIVDIVSAETDKALHVLKKIDKNLGDIAIKISSGLDLDRVKAYLPDDLFSKKENIILTVGRIGIEAKNNELLLNTLATIDLKGWKAVFVGPIASEFKPVIDTFFQEHPDKKGQVIFTGPIIDRKELWQYYAKAKLFCLTSRRESFGMVLIEAQKAGNYIIGTDTISSIDELTDNGKLGDIVASGDVKALSKSLERCMKKDFYSEVLMNGILRKAKKYDWSLILRKLDEEICKSITSNNKA